MAMEYRGVEEHAAANQAKAANINAANIEAAGENFVEVENGAFQNGAFEDGDAFEASFAAQAAAPAAHENTDALDADAVENAREDAQENADARGRAAALDGRNNGDENDPRQALSHLKQAARQNPGSSRHLAELAEGYAAADLPHKALQQYQRALQTQREAGEEEAPDAHLGIGDLCRTFAMSAAAVRSYERAVRLRPRRPYYRWKLAVALAALGLYEQSESQLLKAIELAPRDTYYRFQLADVYLLMGRDEQAIESLQEVVALAPRDDYYRLRLGAALLRAGRAEEAVPHFERAVQLKPQNNSYRTLLRYAYTRHGAEPAIAVDVEMLELSPYDEDFVRRIQRLAQPS